MTEYNVGDKVRFIGKEADYTDLTFGKEYAIVEVEDDVDIRFYDDAGDDRYISIPDKDFKLIVEQTPVPAVSPELTDLLANISRRLYEVEESLKPSEPSGANTQAESVDNVNSPQHYRHGRFETIEIIEDITKKYDDGFVAYCVGNAVKYIDRAPFKHGSPAEDLRKAAWYLTRAADYTTPSTGK